MNAKLREGVRVPTLATASGLIGRGTLTPTPSVPWWAWCVVIDHLGWLGAPEVRASAPRILGVALLVIGFVLVQRR